MTRNSMDDLYLLNTIITNYISFLIQRNRENYDFLISKYEDLETKNLHANNLNYLNTTKEFHIKSYSQYQNLLDNLNSLIDDYYNEFYVQTDLYAKEDLICNCKDHIKFFEELYKQLLKN